MIEFYIMPMTEGPYSIENNQRPMYLDELQCNWSGYPLFGFKRYLCQVNTTTAKHDQLVAKPGVMSLRGLTTETKVGTLQAAATKKIKGYLTSLGLPYDANETIGDLIVRVIGADDPGHHFDPRKKYVPTEH